MPKAFMSYSWDCEEHKEWVRDLAAKLRTDGVEVTLDQWSVVLGDQLPQFMEKCVSEHDFVLIVCTHKYKVRSDNRVGGVGYEGDIMTAEVYAHRNSRKFIPILREPPWELAGPAWLRGACYVDMSPSAAMDSAYQLLLSTLHGDLPKAPAVGKYAPSSKPRPQTKMLVTDGASGDDAEFEPITIVGVVTEEVGAPRADGSRGSGLYPVPLRLTRVPPGEWARMFVALWDDPPKWSSMHRPGIASVVGDRLVLGRTTIEEVASTHRETLKLCVDAANAQYLAYVTQKRAAKQRETDRLAEHKRRVDEQAKRLKF